MTGGTIPHSDAAHDDTLMPVVINENTFYCIAAKESRELTGKIKQQIVGLGETANAIAETLKLEGIKGDKGNASACALARYVEKHFGEDINSVDVSTRVNVYYDANEHGGWEYEGFMLPEPAAEFIVNFDAGQYPDLVE